VVVTEVGGRTGRLVRGQGCSAGNKPSSRAWTTATAASNGISGTTINGDGSISLILDIPQLVRFVREREDSRLQAGKASRTLLQ